MANTITKIDNMVLIIESILVLLFIPFALIWMELLLIIQVGMEITNPIGGMKKEMTENNNVHISLLRCVTTIFLNLPYLIFLINNLNTVYSIMYFCYFQLIYSSKHHNVKMNLFVH